MAVKKKVDWRIIIAAMVAITILECVALLNGVNGTILTMAVAVIAGLAGFLMPSPIQTK